MAEVEGVTLSEIRRVLLDAGMEPSRALGQNFLIDANIARKIAALLDGVGRSVIEIGPGLGSLTVQLGAGFDRVVTIEADRYIIPPLQGVLASRRLDNIEIIYGDALVVDLASIASGEGDWGLASNLPYNISANVVVRVLEEVPSVSRLVVMVQLEVAERLVGGTAAKSNSALTVKSRFWADSRIALKVPASVFHPRPNVDSAVVVMERHSRFAPIAPTPLYAQTFAVVKEGFGHRRQMLRRALSELIPEDRICAVGIDPTRRAETLEVEEWVRLGEVLGELSR